MLTYVKLQQEIMTKSEVTPVKNSYGESSTIFPQNTTLPIITLSGALYSSEGVVGRKNRIKGLSAAISLLGTS